MTRSTKCNCFSKTWNTSAALTDSERWKIRCALKHFNAIGIEAKLDYIPYAAPVKDYRADFKDKVPQP